MAARGDVNVVGLENLHVGHVRVEEGKALAAIRKPLNIISLGGGVQSSTMALMAVHGEITPMPDGAIFADTMAEPKAVYEWLDSLEKQLPFPVYRVTAGSLRDEILGAMLGSNRMDARPPFFTLSGGMLRRQCTQDFKLLPIQRPRKGTKCTSCANEPPEGVYVKTQARG